jgi:benzoyl-CoA reductase/2-hydroxyglutaryl-CoA dehydratase subunit BcrC/BadD/HgdB
MMKILSDGLFDRLALLLSILDKVPTSLVKTAGGPLYKFKGILPDEMASAVDALMAPRTREAGVMFLKLLCKWVLDARDAERQGKKVILAPFNFPIEIINAFDKGVPLTSEVLTTLGVIALKGQGEPYWDMAMGLGFPDHLCSANTVALGSILSGEDFKPDALVSSAPGGCDVNSKIHEFVSTYLDIPQFFLQKPPDDTGRGRKQYSVYMRNLISQLEDFLDEKMTEDKLRPVIEKCNRCTELYYELFDLQKAIPCPVPNVYSLLIYGVRFSMWGTDEGIQTLETMARTANERLANKEYPAEKEVARSLWAYTSYYFDLGGFFNWMEEQGYSHLGDGLDLFWPSIIDTSSMDLMLEGLTEAAWNMPMTRQVGAESMSRSWSDDVVNAAKELNADSVIFCGHHSCKQTWSVASILRKELMERAGLPLLVLQGDSWIKTMTPMSVIQDEIDEFIKNVVAKKPASKRKLRKRRRVESA